MKQLVRKTWPDLRLRREIEWQKQRVRMLDEATKHMERLADVKERLGERIRRKRAEHKLGLRETATKVGISPTYLSRIETMDEKTPPAEDVIRKLATLLNDDFDELMQLAGRVPEDVEKVIKGDPSMPAFLRTAKEQKLSGDDLMKLIEAQKKGKR